jgi:hypothetical protein
VVNHRPHCNACGRSVALSYGTAYYRLKADRALFEMAVRALAEGNARRATARMVQVDKDTVCAWLDRAVRHCRTVMLSLWHTLHVRECQLDELWPSENERVTSGKTILEQIKFQRLVDQKCEG